MSFHIIYTYTVSFIGKLKPAILYWRDNPEETANYYHRCNIVYQQTWTGLLTARGTSSNFRFLSFLYSCKKQMKTLNSIKLYISMCKECKVWESDYKVAMNPTKFKVYTSLRKLYELLMNFRFYSKH